MLRSNVGYQKWAGIYNDCRTSQCGSEMINIETTRYSATVRAFVEEYPSAVSMLDDRVMHESPDKWCVNSNLKSAIDFSLTENGSTLLAFHDGPRNMWASMGTLPLVQSLADQKLLRFNLRRTTTVRSALNPIKTLSQTIKSWIAMLLTRRGE